jgi:excinuclease ABC subunit A
MSRAAAMPPIRLRGVRHNNLKGFDLELPARRLIVLTGLSGSGKSSLAFDTLYAEGQRRYLETFSPYARQFFDRMDKPRVDHIEGIPPAIALEQRNTVRTTRSTVGTMTEICDYLKALWPHLAQLHCRGCGRPVRKDTPQSIWETLLAEAGPAEPPGKDALPDTGGRRPEAGGPAPEAAHPGPGEPRGIPGTEAAPVEPGTAAGRLARAESVREPRPGPEVLVTFDLPLTEKLSLRDSLDLVAKQGYQRLLLDGEVVRIEDAPARLPGLGQAAPGSRLPVSAPPYLTVIQDRLRLVPAQRSRFIEACEQAYHFGKGRLAVHFLPPGTAPVRRFSNRRHCAECDLEYDEPTPALFSFNHPLGACPTCKGFGRIISIDYRRAIPDRSLTLAEGAVKPWRSGFSAECQADLVKFCRARGVPMNVPFRDLSPEHQRWVIEGDPDYGVDEEHEWPRAWYGVKGYFRWLESKAYKMHVRVLLSRYRAYTPCPDCGGRRLKPEALLYRLKLPESGGGKPQAPAEAGLTGTGLTLADFYALPLERALAIIETLRRRAADFRALSSPSLQTALEEVHARLGYLVEVGLGYLTLDRPTRTLSGGETERVNLTTCLGTRLVNTLFVLDEPTVGLHPRDTARLVRLLERLRDAGNTVVVVEHEPAVMRAADQIVDLGPGHGETGGRVVFQGTCRQLLRCRASLTGQYLSGRRRIEIPARRPVAPGTSPEGRDPGPAPRNPPAWLRLAGVTRHNLRDLAVEIPLGRFVCVTGVSGSGKSTLIREVLYPALHARLGGPLEPLPAGERLDGAEDADDEAGAAEPESAVRLEGAEALGRVVLVDQAPLGRTPRSNPGVYLGAFDDLRELFAASEAARARGLTASAFSFNSAQGQCQRCRGAGFEKIEMQFLSDVFIRCPDCDGRRYRDSILEVKIRPPGVAAGKSEVRSPRSEPVPGRGGPTRTPPAREWSIADVLEATVEEVRDWLEGFGDARPARRAAAKLQVLLDVGLGYLRLGQPLNTLSGGECQRLKLAAHLAEHLEAVQVAKPDLQTHLPAPAAGANAFARPTLFLFDEPTTGLHFEDVRVLLEVFQRLVDAGHSVVVIEHNLEVIKCADWVIDLGPEAGEAGGRVVVTGPPEAVAACAASHTGRALREVGITPAPEAAHRTGS